MATKFEAFLQEKKINPLRVLSASAKLERLRPEDRAVRLAERLARKSEDGAKKKSGEARKKPHTGRPITNRTLSAAIIGKSIAGPAKTRLLRAVNHLLELKKLEPVALSALFDAPKKAAAAPAAEAS